MCVRINLNQNETAKLQVSEEQILVIYETCFGPQLKLNAEVSRVLRVSIKFQNTIRNSRWFYSIYSKIRFRFNSPIVFNQFCTKCLKLLAYLITQTLSIYWPGKARAQRRIPENTSELFPHFYPSAGFKRR